MAIRVLDSVKDRLAAFYHWNDRQGLEQAINICSEQKIDLTEIERWSLKEEQLEKFKKFKQKLDRIINLNS